MSYEWSPGFKEGWASETEKQRLMEQWMTGKADFTLGYIEEAFGTVDFSNALVDAANVSAMEGYNQVEPYWRLASKIVTRNDFKTNYVVEAGGMGLLEKRIELEPSKLTKPTDRKESYAIYPYDRVFGLTMEAQANDVTGVLMENFRTFGQAAAQTLNDFVWGTSGLLGGTGSGGTLSDGYAMFSASHTNANYASNALNFENLGIGISAMRQQPDAGGTQIAGITPRYLFVCPELEATAVQLTQSPALMATTVISPTTGTAALAGTTNPWKGRLQPVVINELASTEWVLGADPAIYPCLEMGFYQGRTEPTIMIQPPDSDSEFWQRARHAKAMLVFGGRQKSWKTFYKGVG